MAFYPDVQSGQAYKPSAALENDMRHFFNQLNGFTVAEGFSVPSVGKLAVYNIGTEILPAESAISPAEEGKIIDGAIPVRQYQQGDNYFGVLLQELEPGAFDSCIISGPVEVSITGTGNMAQPSADGKSFKAGSSGSTTVLYTSGGRGIILLGAGRGTLDYRGYHKLAIKEKTDENGNVEAELYVGNGAFYGTDRFFKEPSFVKINGAWTLPMDATRFIPEKNGTWFVDIVFTPTGAIPDKSMLQYELAGSASTPNEGYYSDSRYTIGCFVWDGEQYKVVQQHQEYAAGNGLVKLDYFVW